MKMLNFALIGFGYWGPNYARLLHEIGNSNLRWIVDINNSLLKKAKADYPYCKITSNYLEALKDSLVDAVIIATPTSTHKKIAADVLKNKKHVLVEKPLALSASDAEELYKLAKSQKVVLMAGHTYLFNPAVSYLKKEVDKGTLGKILYFIAQRTNLGPIRKDVNALWDLGPHDISIILYLTNSKPTSVTATGVGYINKNNPDVVNLTITFANKVFANITLSWIAPVKVRSLTIVGNKKMALYDDVAIDGKIRIINKTLWNMKKGKTISFGEYNQLSQKQGSTIIPTLPTVEPLKAEILDFLESITLKKNTLVKPTHVIETVRILEAAQKSLDNKTTINL